MELLSIVYKVEILKVSSTSSDITLEDIDEETFKKFVQKGNEKGRLYYKYI